MFEVFYSKQARKFLQQAEKILADVGEKRRTRPQNNLTVKANALIEETVRLVKIWLTKNTTGVSVDDLQSEAIRRLVDEINYFNPQHYANLQELKKKWESYIFAKNKKTGRRRINNFVIDALRNIGPRTRRGRQRRPTLDEYIEVKPANPIHLFQEKLDFHRH